MLQTPVLDGSDCPDWQKVRATNSTQSGSFESRVPTATEPTEGNGVVRLKKPAGWTPTRMMILPYAAGANNNTMLVLVRGWNQIAGLWIPVVLWQGTCTISSSAPGVAGKAVVETEYFADTIVTSKGNDGVDCQPFSPANDTIGHVVVDVKGCEYVEVQFDRNASSTSCNALIRSL